MRSGAAAFILALGLIGCEDSSEQPPSNPTATDQATGSKPVNSSEYDPDACERDAKGQTACLAQTFAAEECADASVLGSAFRSNDKKKTFWHRTAYGVSAECLDALREAASRRLLSENDNGEFVLERQDGYREALIIGLQVSEDGTVIEWERGKE